MKPFSQYQKLIGLVLLFGSTLSMAFLFLELLSMFGVIQLQDKGVPYIVALLSFCLILALITRKVSIHFNRHVPLDKTKGDIFQSLKGIRNYTRLNLREPSYYKLLFYQWRLYTELNKSKAIHAGRLRMDCMNEFDYTVYIFRSVMNMLKEGDEYFGLCDMNFWNHVSFGRDYFMRANIDAIERGVTIKRLIIINKSTLNDLTTVNYQKRSNLKSLVNSLVLCSQRNPDTFNKMNLKFYIHDDRNDTVQFSDSFALIKNSKHQDHMVLVPSFNVPESKPAIEIYFNSQKDKIVYVNRFKKFEELFKSDQTYTLKDMVRRLSSDPDSSISNDFGSLTSSRPVIS